MFNIYIDEAGNTGGNLADPNQRIFVLCALLVPDNEESQLVLDLQRSVAQAFPKGVPTGFELHATELFSGNGSFAVLSEQDRLRLAKKWLEAAHGRGCRVAFRFLDKTDASQSLGSRIPASTALQFHPYSVAFAQLAPAIDRYIASTSGNAQGRLVFDENKEVAKWMRNMMDQHLGTVADTPFPATVHRIMPAYLFADSKSLVQLQLCDLCAHAASKGAAKRKHGTAVRPGILRVCAKIQTLLLT